jgi:hypothetical protein
MLLIDVECVLPCLQESGLPQSGLRYKLFYFVCDFVPGLTRCMSCIVTANSAEWGNLSGHFLLRHGMGSAGVCAAVR